MKRYVLLAMVLSITLCIVSCNASLGFYTISPGMVKEVRVSALGTESEVLDAAQVNEFLQLYHGSEYRGKSDGSGTTPRYQVDVTLKDGRVLHIYEFAGNAGNLEVQFPDANGITKLGVILGYYHGYYLQSQALEEFITELCFATE